MNEFTFQDKTIVFIIKVCALAGAERQALGLAKYLGETYNCNIHLNGICHCTYKFDLLKQNINHL